MVEESVPIGIPKLDFMMGGGLIKGRTYLVAGETGVGKTILSLQFLLTGLKNAEKCVYVSLDERIKNVLSGAQSLGWDLWNYVKIRTLLPVELRLDAEELRKYGKDSRSFINSIRSLTGGAKVQRVVLDPISALAQGAREAFVTREYLRQVLVYLEENIGATTMLTADIPTGTKSLSRYGFEEFLASGVIVLGIRRLGGKLVRTMYVRKMRWTPIDTTIFTFDVAAGEGIVVGEPLEHLLARTQLQH